MSRSGVVVVGVLFALLLIGGRDRDPTEVEAKFAPAPAPTQVESEVPVPALEPVPLAISETTPTPGWDTAEEQIVDWFGELGRAALGQLAFAVAGVIVVLGLMYYAERRRAG